MSWLPPSRKPGVLQKRKMLGCLVKCAIKLEMKDHFYAFNNVIKKGKGGAIGNKLTEMLGKLLMKRFDKKYLKLLEKLGILNELYERYVDDQMDTLAAIDPGVRFDGKKLVVVKKLLEEDKALAEDVRAMNNLKDIDNYSYNCMQYTIPCPTFHSSGMVPILNLQVNTENNQLVHNFFEKTVACKGTIPYGSAHSLKMKMAVFVEEGMRRRRNMSRGLEWEHRRKVRTHFSMKLRRSGYPETTRHQVIKTVCEKWKRA